MDMIDLFFIKKHKITEKIPYEDISKLEIEETSIRCIVKNKKGTFDTHKITFNNNRDREQFMFKLYKTCFYRVLLGEENLTVSGQYLIEKKGEKIVSGKILIMICLDSMLIQKDQSIEYSIGFASIENMSILPFDANYVRMEVTYKDTKDPLLSTKKLDLILSNLCEGVREKMNYLMGKFNDASLNL